MANPNCDENLDSDADSSEAKYATQYRGDRSAYDRYLASMDASMKQKIALTAAHLMALGRVADMGMGSGTGSEALASLYPSLEVVGVDISDTMVALAQEKFQSPNLSFIQGDIAAPCFEAETLDGIFNSSVLHHVTSFNDYDHQAANRALEVQALQLKSDGVLIVRDFLAPEAELAQQSVFLDLPNADGHELSAAELAANPDRIPHCSSASLLLLFAQQFRKLHNEPGFTCVEVTDPGTRPSLPALPQNWRRFQLSYRMAVEFVLRKDYRADWATEVLEEYTYFSQTEFQQHFAKLGLRSLASTPIRNPWIVNNRFKDQFQIWTEAGQRLEWPATNIIVVGEKVPANQGLRFQAVTCEPLGFLALSHYRNQASGTVYDLVRRPHLTIDVLPWFRDGAEFFVLARKSYPRPIVGEGVLEDSAPDESLPAVYLTETLNVLQTDQPMGRTVEQLLAERADIGEEQIIQIHNGGHYYPSPGGIEEEVQSKLVEVDKVLVKKELPAVSGFSTSGQVRAIEARQALRAAQVSGLPCNRLELNIYELLLQQQQSPGQWIGESLKLTKQSQAIPITAVETLINRPQRRLFRRCDRSESHGFLELRARQFQELNGSGSIVAERKIEYVVPKKLSCFTVVSALLYRYEDQILFALDDDDLPAAQGFTGHSEICVVPAWRLPKFMSGMSSAREWVKAKVESHYSVAVEGIYELGGYYHPSPGVTPEIVYPHAFEVTALDVSKSPKSLHWVNLKDLVARRNEFQDGHLLTAILRCAHATGLL